MANVNIDDLSAASALDGSELVETLQGGVNKKTTTQDIADLGVTIYTGNGSLSGDRIVDANGHFLHISNITNFSVSNGSETLLDIGTLHSSIESNDGTSRSGLSVIGNVGDETTFDLFSDNGANLVNIKGDAVANSIAYTADTHTFNTGITITDLAGVGTRAIAVDANGKIVLL